MKLQPWSVWEVLFESDQELLERIPLFFETSIQQHKDSALRVGERDYLYFLCELGALGVMILVREKPEGGQELCSIYGLPRRYEIQELEVMDWEEFGDDENEGIYGVVTCINEDGVEVKHFCYDWLAVGAEVKKGGRFKYELAGIVNVLEKAEKEFVVKEGDFYETEKNRRMREEEGFDPESFEGVTVSMENLRSFHSSEESAGEASFQLKIEAVEVAEMLPTFEQTIYRLKVNLARDEFAPLWVALLVPGKVLQNGYVPAVGDMVRGMGVFQGSPIRRVEMSDGSWLDQGTEDAAAPDPMMWAMIHYLFGNPHLPLGYLMIGAGMKRAGWDEIEANTGTFESWQAAFYGVYQGVKYVIYVDTYLDGRATISSRESYRKEIWESAEKVGYVPLMLRVNLRYLAQGYELESIEGLSEEQKGMFRCPLQVKAPEFSAPLKVGKPEVEPVFDEWEIARIFCEGMTQRNLDEFSAKMVEDAEMSSPSLDADLFGRHQVLAYLSEKLAVWEAHGNTPRFALATTAEGHPCVIAVATEDETIRAVSTFRGRRGYVEAIVNLSSREGVTECSG